MDLSVLDRAPEAGDVEAVDGLVAGFVARAERFASRASSVRGAADVLVAASTGRWATALGERSARLAGGLDDAARGCRDVAGVLAGYGAALRALERRVMVARHLVGTARIRATAARERYAAASSSAGGLHAVPWSWTDVPAVAAAPEAADELRAWRDAVADASEGLHAFVACCDEREDLDRQTAARLAGVDVMTTYAPGTEADAVIDVPLVQALAAAGAGTVTSQQRALLADWFVDAADAVEVEPLTSFLAAWGTDADVMVAVFDTMGAERTARLLTFLGDTVRYSNDHVDSTLSALGMQVRAGLAAASHRWSPAQTESFADGLLHQILISDGASIAGYLFAEPDDALMSAAFTVAVADRLDAWEQEHGRPSPGRYHPGYWLAESADPGSDPRGLIDPASAVFTTLARYPDDAREWLVGSAAVSAESWLVSSRIDYWFRLRDWPRATSDGFAGVGQLWASAQEGIIDLRTAETVAAVSERVFNSLSLNAAFVTGAASADASVAFAHALERQLAGLVESPLLIDPGEEAGAWTMVKAPYRPTRLPAPVVSLQDFLAVLAAAVEHEDGRSVVQQAVVDYQTRALAAIDEFEASPSEVLERLARLWGTLDGAVTVAQQEAARLEIEARIASFTPAAEVSKIAIGLLPVSPVVGVIIGQGVDRVEAVVLDEIRASVVVPPSPTIDRRTFLDQSFGDLVASFQRNGTWDLPTLHAGDDPDAPDDTAQRLTTTYLLCAMAVQGIHYEARTP